MLKAVFYARFHPERGPSIIHQYPSDSAAKVTLFEWSDISSYIIPPHELCNQALSISTRGHRILSFPVALEDAQYERNRFTFNVCFALADNDDAQAWEHVVRKTADFFARLEKEEGLLQAEETLDGLKLAGEEGYPVSGVGVVYNLLEGIVEDLNAYGEACVRVGKLHVLNLRLGGSRSTPTKVHSWDVPLLIRNIPDSSLWTWDLALRRIHPQIDGVKHVQKIAELADVELKLVKSVLRELLYSDIVMLIDIFHYQAIYTCGAKIVRFIDDEAVQDECRRYVVKELPNTEPANRQSSHFSVSTLPTRDCILELYCSLQATASVSQFCQDFEPELSNIDIRRFITFGVIKGFLRRVHKYIYAADPTARTASPLSQRRSGVSRSKPKSNEDILKEFDRAWKKAVLSSGWATPPSGPPLSSLGKSQRSADEVRSEEDEKLKTFLDGSHCLDEICTEMHMSEKRVLERLRSGRFGEVTIFNK